MWQLPAMEVGAYAEKDAELTLELWQKLKKIIIEEDLQDIFNLETDLFPCLVDMRFLGVRVDVQKAHELKRQLTLQEEMLLHKVKKKQDKMFNYGQQDPLPKFLNTFAYLLTVPKRQTLLHLQKTFFLIMNIL